MGIKSFLSKPFATNTIRKVEKWKNNPLAAQEKWMNILIDTAKETNFGIDHNFDSITDYESFKRNIPVNDYEGLRPYVDKMVEGQEHILWPGKPLYYAKTSGTTSGAKWIPISKESMPFHIKAAKYALMSYIKETGNAQFVDGKMIFLQGSPVMFDKNGVQAGRLSGIVAHHVPKYLQKNRLPSFETNCIDDWETKLDAVVKETKAEDMTLISGIPSWVQMYFERLIETTGKDSIKDLFPNFSLFVFGGVNFQPYKARFKELIGKEVPTVETYPASEGFIAFQDSQTEEGLLLYVDGGIFYEFIPSDEFFNENPTRISLKDVQIGINYVIILNTNAGLWGYNIGDTIKFVSTKPYRIIVTGRIKHYTSAFGEHVIAEEVEKAMQTAIDKTGNEVVEFTVAPQVNPENGLPYHEWFIEFADEPESLAQFSEIIDESVQKQNIYYKDLLEGNILRPIVVTRIQKGGFNNYMKSIGKLGGQNKIPRLSNDRTLADKLTEWKH